MCALLNKVGVHSGLARCVQESVMHRKQRKRKKDTIIITWKNKFYYSILLGLVGKDIYLITVMKILNSNLSKTCASVFWEEVGGICELCVILGTFALLVGDVL